MKVFSNEALRSAFSEAYGQTSRIFRAPGRVNLIGEHTDYNDGFVMPCAIGFSTYVAISRRADRLLRFRSTRFDGEFTFDLDEPSPANPGSWAKYVVGVASILGDEGFSLEGADVLIDSDVPIGAGLSSSASLEVAVGFALTKISDVNADKWTLAKIGQRAEHEFAGVRSGIMDQFASAFGVREHALLLDCRSLEWTPLPLAGAKFIICNTRTKHDLADGEYNLRRADCEQAARILGKKSLRDAGSADLLHPEMTGRILRRARHVITENQRTIDAAEALKRGELTRFGELMNESHNSLRDDYEVSCRELDIMVDVLRAQSGVIGARMTGGGFGGCAVALLGPNADETVSQPVLDEFHQATGIEAEIYPVAAADGASEIL